MSMLITGGQGQLAKSLVTLCQKNNIKFWSPSKFELDITNSKELHKYISIVKPETVVNAAAWTNVEAAQDNAGLVFKINSDAVRDMSELSLKLGFQLIQISTDYIFSGSRKYPWETNDLPKPINVYGESKYLAEKEILTINPNNSKIIRTAWLYSEYGNNFVKKMIYKVINNNFPLKVVDDQFGQPTSTHTLAKYVLELSKNEIEPGIYHVTNSGVASWYEFSRSIFDLMGWNKMEIDSVLEPISSFLLQTKAKRPEYSVLSADKLTTCGLLTPSSWQDELTNIFPVILRNVREGL